MTTPISQNHWYTIHCVLDDGVIHEAAITGEDGEAAKAVAVSQAMHMGLCGVITSDGVNTLIIPPHRIKVIEVIPVG